MQNPTQLFWRLRLEACRDALAENPSAIGYHERRKAVLELERYSEAVKDFSEALKMQPNQRGSLFGRGKAYWRLGRRQAAAHNMRKAAELGQGQAKKWLNKHPFFQ